MKNTRTQSRSQHNSTNATLQDVLVEVDNQRKPQTRRPQVADCLGHVHRVYPIYCLRLHTQLILDEQINSLRADQLAVISNGNCSLRIVRHAILFQLKLARANEALARARMGAAGLPLPPLLVTAERVSASKPDPEGFLKGAAELGFAPEECLVFEDAEVGIAAAKAAGMRVVGVGPRATAHQPTAHVASLEQVRVEAAPDGTLLVTT